MLTQPIAVDEALAAGVNKLIEWQALKARAMEDAGAKHCILLASSSHLVRVACKHASKFLRGLLYFTAFQISTCLLQAALRALAKEFLAFARGNRIPMFCR